MRKIHLLSRALLLNAMNSTLSVIFILLVSGPLMAQVPVVLPQAHAHNDYLHRHPLKDALHFGFCSVEADVHLSGGNLYLGHIAPQKTPNKTLQAAYLDPLYQLIRKNGGSVYPGYTGVFYLMIDVKSDPVATYNALSKAMTAYPEFANNPHFVIFLSGKRPIPEMLADSARTLAVDGRPSDLGKGYDPSFMPVISDNYKNYFKWNGTGLMPTKEFKELQAMTAAAHAEGKKFRLWAIPDRPEAWKALQDAGVDLINTDRLAALSAFMRKN
jgi:hypothetical protein